MSTEIGSTPVTTQTTVADQPVAAWRRYLRGNELVLVVVLIAELILFSSLSPYFLDLQNLLDTSRFFAESGLVALGMTLVIVTGGIDLSVGALLALVSVSIGFTYAAGVPFGVSLLIGLLAGLIGGFFNGYLISVLNLSPLAVTLGTFSLFRGLAYVISDAGAVSDFPSWFAYFGQYYVGGYVPLQLIVFAVAAVIIGTLLSRGRFGRGVVGVGLNARTTRMSGISVNKTVLTVYVLVGLLVAIAAMIYTSRVSTSRANAGLGLELTAIAAVVLGGSNIKGGSGSIIGTVLGVLILAFLSQGMILVGASTSVALMIQGAVLVIAVFVNEIVRRRQKKF